MDPDLWLEKQEQQLSDDLENGRISSAEYNREMQALHREYREMAREAAQESYDREMERW